MTLNPAVLHMPNKQDTEAFYSNLPRWNACARTEGHLGDDTGISQTARTPTRIGVSRSQRRPARTRQKNSSPALSASLKPSG